MPVQLTFHRGRYHGDWVADDADAGFGTLTILFKKLREIIAAFIRTEFDGALKADELKVHCRTFLSPQKTPTKWVVVDEFPMTGSGKVQKFAIREKWLSGKYGVEIHDNSN